MEGEGLKDLIRVGQAIVQILHAVIGLVGEVKSVTMLDHACPKGQRQLGFHETDEGVDEGCRDGHGHPLKHGEGKSFAIAGYDVANNDAIEKRDIYAEKGAYDESRCVDAEKEPFLAVDLSRIRVREKGKR